MAKRIQGGVVRSEAVVFLLDGNPVSGFEGETVAAALMAAGVFHLRSSPRDGTPRGAFCLMGVCQECVVRVENRMVPSCTEPVRRGLEVFLNSTNVEN